MRRTLRALLAATVAVIGAGPAAAHAGAQSRALVLGAGLAELDSATGAALLRELDAASARGLPTAPLLAKAREGRLKRASGARIRSAVAALAVRLDSASAALGPAATNEELVAGADALAAGATPAALRSVRGASRQPSVSVALGALTQLVASGVPAPRATVMVVELLRRSATPSQLVAFGNAVESDVAGGLPADESAAFRLRSASATVAGAVLSTDNLSNAAVAPASTRPAPSSTPRRRP